MIKFGVIFNYIVAGAVIYTGIYNSDVLLPFISENYEASLAVAGAFLSSLSFAYKRRVVTKRHMGEFFKAEQLMRPLTKNRSRYSDRMAYILAEMSELAYFEVERENDNLVQFVNKAMTVSNDENEAAALKRIVQYYKKITRTNNISDSSILTIEDLKRKLEHQGFSLRGEYLNSGSAQGFVCIWNPPQDNDEGLKPYIVVAFRGSEKKIEDWLTNADAVPSDEVSNGKVHKGFYEDFKGIEDQLIKTLNEIMGEFEGEDIPVYFTGHSLGGAVATIATKEIMPDGEGACYTFGAPRVGDYRYFEFVKTPVYRVVNSSDIVPRVPPGAWTTVISKLLTLLRYLTIKIGFIEQYITIAERFVNRLKDYRHFGDQRYLTDVPDGGFDKVRVLRNPNYLDVVQWFWRHLSISFGMPVKSHSMTIYRKKLKHIGVRRIEHITSGAPIGCFE